MDKRNNIVAKIGPTKLEEEYATAKKLTLPTFISFNCIFKCLDDFSRLNNLTKEVCKKDGESITVIIMPYMTEGRIDFWHWVRSNFDLMKNVIKHVSLTLIYSKNTLGFIHRDTVCEPDFTLTVREKIVETESDAVEYFNALNNVKRQFWKTDPNLIVNKYIQAMEKKYNTNTKTPLIRPKAHRPYLSSDKLRDVLLKCSGFLKNSNDDIAKFVKLSAKENVSILNNLEMRLLSFDKNKTTIEKAL